jgi:hypothetical protein
MGQHAAISAVELGRKRQEFMARAGEAFDQMFGCDGQNDLVTFAQREDRACDVTDELARWLMVEHVSLDGATQVDPQAGCPVCGGPLQGQPTPQQEGGEVRELATRRGKVQYRRAGAHCPRCRRVFFPPG